MNKLIYLVSFLALYPVCHAAKKNAPVGAHGSERAPVQSAVSQSLSSQAGDQGMGDYVKQLRAQGLKGQDLADAIHAEQIRRGIGQGHGKPGGSQVSTQGQTGKNSKDKSKAGGNAVAPVTRGDDSNTELTEPADDAGNPKNGQDRDAENSGKGKGKGSHGKK